MTPEARAKDKAAPAERGERRGEILAATVRLLGSDGLGAVTHRAVAAEADVPLAATTYYFESKDDLIAEALALLAAAEVERLSEAAAGLGENVGSGVDAAEALVATLLPVGGDGERALIAKFELFLAAAREPRLQPAIADLEAALRRLAAAALETAGARDPEESARMIVAASHGILLEALSGDPETRGRAALVSRYQRLFERFLP